MNNRLLFLSLLLCFYSCKSQDIKHVDFRSSDIIIFEMNSNDIRAERKPTQTFARFPNVNIYKEKKVLIFQAHWQYMGQFEPKFFEFYKEKDTMRIECRCGQLNNLYIKNLDFHKGNYYLNIKKPKEKIRGRDIKTSKNIQDLLFKNSYIKASVNPDSVYKDTYFRNLKLYRIDLKDTINVKLERTKQ